ncbi:MAG: DNA alkylation repair protein [Nitrososphaeraceae archaeon]
MVVRRLANRIKNEYLEFDDNGFCNSINSNISNLNFGERSELIKKNLEKFLPNNFEKAANILVKSLEPELSIEPGKTDWNRFIIIPLSEFISENGLEYYDLSMNSLYEMTKRFSSENAIRPFIKKYPDKTLKLLKEWAKDENVHVRRLVSEGTRTRLPLCSRLEDYRKDPKPIINLLELLKDDQEQYVRRSVANNLNDISKDNPKIIIKTLKRWKKDASKERFWIINHALRTLFKNGNIDALELMDFTKPNISKTKIDLDKENIKIGENMIIQIEFLSKYNQLLMIDYIIHFIKSNGKHSEKVFKLTVKTCKKDQLIKIRKKHSFKQMTTRKHYPGIHIIQLLINGHRYNKQEFMLE